MAVLNQTLSRIQPLYQEVVEKAWERIDNLTKPIGSLGKLEEIAAQMAGITGKIYNRVEKKNIVIMCADNGVAEESVSACPQSVTAAVTNNFTRGITGVNALAAFAKADITIVDVGVKADFRNAQIINRKIAYGTKNMLKEPAMTRQEVIQAIETGIEIAENLAKDGVDLLGTGEMGVGNTATSAAILSVLAGIAPDVVVGKGSGLTEAQHEHKKRIVRQAVELHHPDRKDVIDVLSKVGGFDIAGLCGCFLGAARHRIPIVMDGLISSVAALCAYRFNSLVRDYLFPSHLSAEPGATYVMEELRLEPPLHMNMRLGEGSGCPLAFNMIEAALYMMNHMGTFEDAAIDIGPYVDIR